MGELCACNVELALRQNRWSVRCDFYVSYCGNMFSFNLQKRVYGNHIYFACKETSGACRLRTTPHPTQEDGITDEQSDNEKNLVIFYFLLQK